MATHLRMITGETLAVERELAEVASELSTEGRLVGLPGTFGGTFYVNPAQVVYLEQSPEVGSGAVAAEVTQVVPRSYASPAGPSQPPPG